MTWFKVDDGFWGHPKQTALPPGPVALWVRAGSWSGNQLTDGFVPAHMVVMLGAKKRDAELLVIAGLWVQVDEGYQFHDWSRWQPTRGEVEKKRAEDAERKAEWRRKKAAAAEMSQRDSARTDAVTPRGVRSTRPDPTRPDPSSPTEMTTSKTSQGGITEGNAHKPPPLPDRCTRHAHTAEPGNCGGCADVRKANAQRPLSLVPADAAWPLHCGNCDENRHVKTARGMKRCPECHPLAEEAS